MSNKSNRPYVICHMVSSIDGKIDGEYFGMPETREVLAANRDIVASLNCRAVLNGTVTSAEIYADGYIDALPKSEKTFERKDNIADRQAERYVVCIDTEGTLNWRGSTVERRGQVSHVIAILCENVRDDYIAFLQEQGVSYLFAGQTTLELPLLLEKLGGLGFERLLTTGGGVMNWSLLQSGCLDELSLVIAPVTSGETDAASVFDRSDFMQGHPAAFELMQMEKLESGAVWLKYKSKRIV